MSDRLFDYLVSRLQNRESVNMVIVTITTSASLLLLSLIYDAENQLSIPIIIVGVLFSAIGIAYHELTYFGIHNNDHIKINDILKKEFGDDVTHDFLHDETDRKKRIVLKRFLFFIPLFGWGYVLGTTILQQPFLSCLSFSSLFAVFVILCYYENKLGFKRTYKKH